MSDRPLICFVVNVVVQLIKAGHPTLRYQLKVVKGR